MKKHALSTKARIARYRTRKVTYGRQQGETRKHGEGRYQCSSRYRRVRKRSRKQTMRLTLGIIAVVQSSRPCQKSRGRKSGKQTKNGALCVGRNGAEAVDGDSTVSRSVFPPLDVPFSYLSASISVRSRLAWRVWWSGLRML